jgi:hypothetical protein
MPTVADYAILLSGVLDGPAADNEITFTMPSTVVSGHRSMLTFTYWASGAKIHIDIEVNGHGVGWYELKNYFGTFSRPIKSNVLKSGGNVIRFIVTNMEDDFAFIKLLHVMLTFHKTI